MTDAYKDEKIHTCTVALLKAELLQSLKVGFHIVLILGTLSM